MNRRDFMKAGAYTALAAGVSSKAQAHTYQIGAYYFPNWHVDPGNERVHGKNWTEWEILKRGEPKFPGHQQPKVPAWGYEDESKPAVFEKKIAAAHHAGLSHFIFDWYWYEGQPFLQGALEKGYLNAGNKKDVRFCLMWANQDWLNLMPARLDKNERPMIYSGAYSPDEFHRMADYVVRRYFSDPAYYRLDGSPYFSIYNLKSLIERMGGLDIVRSVLSRFREMTRAAGHRDLHLNVEAWGAETMADVRKILPSLGVKSVTSYTWVHHYEIPNFPATEYKDALEQAPAYWSKARETFGVPYHPNVSMGWDPSPRTCQSDTFERALYPFTPVLINNSPELFQRGLAQAKSYLDGPGKESKVLTINAWNEWTEGSYLEPDTVHGMDYLNAIRKVFGS